MAPANSTNERERIARLPILGVPVSLTNMTTAVQTIVQWAGKRESHYVCVRDVHGIMCAQNDPILMTIHKDAGMVTPDGMPLVWLGRLFGGQAVDRVCGPDLVDGLCSASVQHRLRHFFFGGGPGIADQMAATLSDRYPGLVIAGTLSPPFGEIAPEEDEVMVECIVAAAPHIVWVGLSTPKQEYWMWGHVKRIPGAILIGVGAAFDFHAGQIARAPRFMQRAGLEWLHRLCREPRRLWRRYLVMAPLFVVRVLGNALLRERHYRS